MVSAVHYAEKHLAPASKHGVILLEKSKAINKSKRREKSQSIKLGDFRNAESKDELNPMVRLVLMSVE